MIRKLGLGKGPRHENAKLVCDENATAISGYHISIQYPVLFYPILSIYIELDDVRLG